MFTTTSHNPYLILASVAVLINLPLGYIREGFPKMSLAWIFWIHASIPLLIFLRFELKTSPWFIPVTIFMAIVGQIIGSRWRRHQTGKRNEEKS